MTKVTYSDPSEGTTYSGYHSIEIVEDGHVEADIHLAPTLVPDLDSPTDLKEFGEQLALFGERLEGIEDEA